MMNVKKIEFPADEKLAAEEITKEVKKLNHDEKKAIFYMLQGVKLFAGTVKNKSSKML